MYALYGASNMPSEFSEKPQKCQGGKYRNGARNLRAPHAGARRQTNKRLFAGMV
jgi:hypothetical protein